MNHHFNIFKIQYIPPQNVPFDSSITMYLVPSPGPPASPPPPLTSATLPVSKSLSYIPSSISPFAKLKNLLVTVFHGSFLDAAAMT